MKCKNCGKDLLDDFIVCPYCATSVSTEKQNCYTVMIYNVVNRVAALKVIAKLKNISIKEAYDLLESPEIEMFRNLTLVEAENIKNEFTPNIANVEIICQSEKKDNQNSNILSSNLTTSDNIRDTFPTLPNNLSIGNLVTDWFGSASISVKFVRTPDAPYVFGNNFFELKRCTKGLDFSSTLKLHESQIIKIYVLNEPVEVPDCGNVAGGALLGGLLFGGVGAIVGGLAEADRNGKTTVFDSSLCIDFWDIKSRKKQTIRFVSNESYKYSRFVNACNANLHLGVH
jgi:hypothetical protein